ARRSSRAATRWISGRCIATSPATIRRSRRCSRTAASRASSASPDGECRCRATRGPAFDTISRIMKLRFVLFAIAALILNDPAAEGKRWWSHVAFLADDGLEGRNVGTPGFEKAAAYVEGQFKEIGLKPGGVSGYRQPVTFETRVLNPEHSKLALVRNGNEEPLELGADASLSARGELDGDVDVPMVFIGYGLSIPEANWDDLAGLDLKGKVAVYLNVPAPANVSDNVPWAVGPGGGGGGSRKERGASGPRPIATPTPACRYRRRGRDAACGRTSCGRTSCRRTCRGARRRGTRRRRTRR